MKKLLILIAIFCYAHTAFAAFTNSYPVTIQHAKVANTDQTDYPIDIDLTQAGLKTVANGGHVQNANGYDIYFYSDAACATRIPAERELYTATTGRYTGWVKKTVLTATDVTIYACYGDSSISTDPNLDATFGATSVWDANFKSVWHLPNGTSLSGTDSTSGAHTMTATGATATAGTVDGAAAFSGSSQYMQSGAYSLGGADVNKVTFSAWITYTERTNRRTLFNTTNTNTSGQWGIEFGNGSGGGGTLLTVIIPGIFLATGGTVTDSNPHFITYVRNGSGATNQFYIDGVAQTMTANLTNTFVDGTEVKNLGVRTSTATQNWQGSIDEARVSNIARTADWITTEYNNEFSTSTFYTIGAENTLATPFVQRMYVSARMFLTGLLFIR